MIVELLIYQQLMDSMENAVMINIYLICCTLFIISMFSCTVSVFSKDGPVCPTLKEAIKEALKLLSLVFGGALIVTSMQTLTGHASQ